MSPELTLTFCGLRLTATLDYVPAERGSHVCPPHSAYWEIDRLECDGRDCTELLDYLCADGRRELEQQIETALREPA